MDTDDEVLYRIDFTVQRRGPGDEDFVDIGFGSSCGSETVNGAAYEVESLIQNRLWETEPGMPDPSEAG